MPPAAPIPWLTPAERAAIGEFASGARARFGPDLIELRLFGSRARGEGSAESDLDVACIVTDTGRARRHELQDLAYDVGLRHGVLVAAMVISAAVLDGLRERERRLALDLDREGVVL